MTRRIADDQLTASGLADVRASGEDILGEMTGRVDLVGKASAKRMRGVWHLLVRTFDEIYS